MKSRDSASKIYTKKNQFSKFKESTQSINFLRIERPEDTANARSIFAVKTCVRYSGTFQTSLQKVISEEDGGEGLDPSLKKPYSQIRI